MIRRLARLSPVLAIFALAAVALPATASAEPAAALTNGRIITLDTAHPQVTSSRVLTGVDPLDTIVAADVRPLNGVLYAVATRPGAAADQTQGRLYTVDVSTGVATLVSATPFATDLLDGGDYAADFNPVVDRLRIVTAAGRNLRVNPADGALAGEDAALNGSTTTLVGLGYDRSVAGATQTTAFGIDSASDTLNTLGSPNGAPTSPNSGTTSLVGALGVDIGGNAGFDISPATGVAYLASGGVVYSVNLATGVATSLGSAGENLHTLAILPASTLQLTAATNAAAETNTVAPITVTRLGSLAGSASVDYATANGTALAPADYTATTGTVTFAPGQSTRTIYVPLVQDNTIEKVTETFTVTLTNATGVATLGAPAATTVTLTDLVTPDKTGPFTLLAPLGLTASATLYTHYVWGTYSCSEACTATVALKLGTLTLGSAKGGTLTRAGAARGRIFVNATGKAALRSAIARSRSGRASVLETVTTTDPYGNSTTQSKRIYVAR